MQLTASAEKFPSHDAHEVPPPPSPGADADPSSPSPVPQPGIQQIEAITTVWTPRTLKLTYLLIWLTYLISGLLSAVSGSLLPYVTSSFASHSLTPTISVVSSIVGGCTNFTVAKILDVSGRPAGYLLCIAIAVIGLVMMAACKTVEAYAAAMVFYTVGTTGLQYALSVFVADTSSLRNRGLMTGLVQSPYLITCWVGGPVATRFLKGAGWGWAYGMFAFLVPAVALPVYGVLRFHEKKAEKAGLVPTTTGRERGVWGAVVFYAREFDAVGLGLLSAGAALFLLPFNLYLLQPAGWRSPLIICLLVFGVILLVVFALWERFFAPVSFIPYTLMADRMVVGACLLATALFFSYFCWYSYFSSFLQVVNDLSITDASYVINTYSVGSVLCALGGGAIISYTKRFKKLCLYGGIPLNILGLGLMIYFRRPASGVGYVVMCQVFISLASGIVIVCDEIAMLAAVSHQHIAVAIATLGFFGNIGGAIGLTVTGAIWQNTFPKALARYLPAAQLENLPTIYGDLETQLSYPVGSPTRIAIQHAYGDAQKDMLIASTAVWSLCIVAVLLWRNTDVSRIKQVKGTVV